MEAPLSAVLKAPLDTNAHAHGPAEMYKITKASWLSHWFREREEVKVYETICKSSDTARAEVSTGAPSCPRSAESGFASEPLEVAGRRAQPGGYCGRARGRRARAGASAGPLLRAIL